MTAPDLDPSTTHLRCGSDIREGLRRAGFVGRFLEFSDPVCQGPLECGTDLIEMRSRFLAATYEIDRAEARTRLDREMDALSESISHPRVVLWFEHDSFDQLILARILAFYAERRAPRQLELICIDQFPGLERFVGLGQLSPRELASLWAGRRPVGPDLLSFGSRVWVALTDPAPLALHELAIQATNLPTMGPALRRHLQELPWTTDGLGLTERLTLELLERGPADERELFRRLTQEVEPLPFLGDTMFAAVLRRLANARTPPIELATMADSGRQIRLTDVGRLIQEGELSWLDCLPPVRWVGGVRIIPGSSVWCWDPSSRRPILREPNVQPHH